MKCSISITAIWSTPSRRAARSTPDQIRALIDSGPFVGDEALTGGLVDG